MWGGGTRAVVDLHSQREVLGYLASYRSDPFKKLPTSLRVESCKTVVSSSLAESELSCVVQQGQVVEWKRQFQGAFDNSMSDVGRAGVLLAGGVI